MRTARNIEFANFVLTFGEDKVLLDFANEIVIPAFTGNHQRTHGTTTYLFLDVDLVDLGTVTSPHIFIVGRFVKDQLLRSDQKLNRSTGELDQVNETMRSSPSAFFALLLNNHQLFYLDETNHAPTLSEFQSTIGMFIRERRRQYLDSVYSERTAKGEKVTRAELRESCPPAELRITPILGNAELDTFISQFSVLKQFTVTIGKTNSQTENSEFMRLARARRTREGAKTLEVTARNNEGLDKDGVKHGVREVATEANAEVLLVGIDQSGDNLRGNAEKFKLKVPVTEAPSTPKDAGRVMFAAFQANLKSGMIKVAAFVHTSQEKIDGLAKQIRAGRQSGE